MYFCRKKYKKVANRFFIKIAYKGTNYHGWQIQPGAITIQGTIDSALKILLKEDINTTGAGRTDTGVHASEFFAHFDTVKTIKEITDLNLTYKLNSILPNDISVHDIIPVKEDAHARFDAISRTYKYYISLQKDPFWIDSAWFFYSSLDMKKMQEATELLFDYQDFSSFSKSNTQVKTNNCKIISASWQQKDNILIFEITANRFLRNMVRAIVGTLIEVGMKKITRTDFQKIIKNKNRSNAGVSAPAQGLYLTNIEYPDDCFLT